MSDFILSCCSSADLSDEWFKKRDIHYVCFHFSLGGKEYNDDMGATISSEELFKRMDAGEDTKTSQVTVGEYIEYFEPFLKEGKDILHLCLSSGISGTYNSACMARDELVEKYPDRKFYIVDSLTASSGFGLFMEILADKRDTGMDIDNLYQFAEDNKLRLVAWFFSSDLTYFIRGGRISKASGTIGNMLNICPLMNIDSTGHLIVREKVRTKKKVMHRIVEKMEEFADEGVFYKGKCFISQSACEADAQAVAKLIEEKFPNLDGKVEIFPIGATIGSHTGPGTVALFFWGCSNDTRD